MRPGNLRAAPMVGGRADSHHSLRHDRNLAEACEQTVNGRPPSRFAFNGERRRLVRRCPRPPQPDRPKSDVRVRAGGRHASCPNAGRSADHPDRHADVDAGPGAVGRERGRCEPSRERTADGSPRDSPWRRVTAGGKDCNGVPGKRRHGKRKVTTSMQVRLATRLRLPEAPFRSEPWSRGRVPPSPR